MSPTSHHRVAPSHVSPVVLLVAACATFGAVAPLFAAPRHQDEPRTTEGGTPPSSVTIVLEEGQRPLLRLAFPAMDRAGSFAGGAGRAADDLEETVRNDLDASRIFETQGPWAFTVLELNGDRTHDLEQYRSLGNEILIEAKLTDEGGKLTFEGRVVDLASQQLVLGKRYRGDHDVARRIGHTFADEVILYFTGQRGLGLTTLAFHSDRTGDKEIYLMDSDGANERRITAHRSVSLFPTFDADDSGVAYVSYLDGSPGIYLADIASGRKRPLVTGGAFSTSPTFSPDGRRMAYSSSLQGNTEIFVAGADGSNPRRLTFTNAIDTNPAWSPKGSEIAFTSSRSGRPEIWMIDPEGSNTQRLSSGGDYNDGATWSPDGTKIAYATRRGGVFQIAITDRVTLETTVITSGGGSKESPAFSPDGKKIAYAQSFSSREGTRTQIWVIDADGRNPVQLTAEGNNFSPDWSGYPK